MGNNKISKYEKYLTDLKGIDRDPLAASRPTPLKIGELRHYYLTIGKKIENSEEFIKQHFSQLWEYYTDKKACDRHPNGACSNPQGVHYDFDVGANGELFTKAYICRKSQRVDENKKIDSLFLVCQINRQNYQKLRLNENYINFNHHESRKQLIARLKAIIDGKQKKGFYLTGKNGIGKTYIMMAACNELALKNKTIAYMDVPECIQYLRQKTSKENDASELSNKMVENFKKADVLVVDSLGISAFQDTHWFYSGYLVSILNWRLGSQCLTFFISNYQIGDLARKLSSPTYFSKQMNDWTSTNYFISRIRSLVGDNYVELLGEMLRSC